MPDGALECIWEPQSLPQYACIQCPVFEIFFGGSRGSLKTDTMLGDWIRHSADHGEDAAGIMLRRTREELMETYERAKQVWGPLGFEFRDAKHMAYSPNGSRIRFAYLERDQDAMKYQGHSYTRVYIEEIGNFPLRDPVLKMMATLRSAKGVPVGFRATGNPGGPGHVWVRERYIDPAPEGWKIITEEYKNPFSGVLTKRNRVFIPGRITDHSLLGDDYIAQLQMQGSEALVKAWLLGDWNAIEGAFFDCWDENMVIEPFEIPHDWPRFRSMDWGSASPFSVGWWAIAQEDWEGSTGRIPRGAMVRYREWYGASGPQRGLKLTAEEVAVGIREREIGDVISYGVLDPSAFAQDGGPSIAERMLSRGCTFRMADNRRIAYHGAMGGWDQMRARMKGEHERPMIYCFNTCTASIRTIPVLQHDPLRAEDLDTKAEDHAADEWRYACMSRPWLPSQRPEKPKQLPPGTVFLEGPPKPKRGATIKLGRR